MSTGDIHPLVAGKIERLFLEIAENDFAAVQDQIAIGSSEGKLGRKFLEGRLRTELSLSDEGLVDLTANLKDHGEDITDKRLESGDEPISSSLRLANFLEDWFSSDDQRFIKIASTFEGGGLEAICIEPKDTSEFLQKCHGAVHMSGTLRPLRQYIDTLDLPETTRMRTFPITFPRGEPTGGLCRGCESWSQGGAGGPVDEVQDRRPHNSTLQRHLKEHYGFLPFI